MDVETPVRHERHIALRMSLELHRKLQAEAISRSTIARRLTVSDVIRELLAERLGQE